MYACTRALLSYICAYRYIYICKYMQTFDNTLMFRYCKQIIPIIIWLTTWVNIRAKSYQVNSEIPKGRLVCIVGK